LEGLALDFLPTSPDQAAAFVWWVSLLLGVVVSLVVTVLLWAIYREASIINDRVSKIWEVGQRVANNTVHIPALYRTNEVASRILAVALEVNAGAAAMQTHASNCPGCPQCMRKH